MNTHTFLCLFFVQWMDIIILRIAAPLHRYQVINKQFQIRACAHHAYLLFGVRAIGAETRNMVLHLEYFKYFDSKICIFCFHILRIISNTFSPLLKLLMLCKSLLPMVPNHFLINWHIRIYVNTTLKQRWNDVVYTTSEVQRCFNVETTYADVVNSV